MPREEELTGLGRLRDTWREERSESVRRFAEERTKRRFEDRVADGLALDRMSVDDVDSVSGGRVRIWASPPKGTELDDVRIGSGDPVRLWWTSPDEPDAVLAVASRRDATRLSFVVEGEASERVLDGGFRVDREAPTTTFDRGDRAIASFADAKPDTQVGRMRALLFGDAVPRAQRVDALAWLDAGLTEDQHRAVTLALAKPLALVHGPPGTGKTRTLVEVVRQAVARGEKVLVAAASNGATDNLASRLLASGVRVVRIGHPARVAPDVEAHTLDAMLEASEAWTLARRYDKEATSLGKRLARGGGDREQRRADRAELRRLRADVRAVLAVEEERILARTPVIVTTAGSADAPSLKRVVFDRVVLDEATQCVDPLALVALARAERATLAGDPEQLPPTVLSANAAARGLGRTLFERLRDRLGAEVTVQLTVQHRMHEDIMRFPSSSMYGGTLVAADAVAHHRLEDLPDVSADPSRDAPWIFVDTAGKGWDEERAEGDPSTSNPGNAERVAAEVRRLLARGVAARDVAVITPYEAQARRLRALLAEPRALGLEVGTVDGFQGREKEAVVVDLVRSNEDGDVGFLADVRRMNVALTRARRFLLVLGDGGTLASHPYYTRLLDAAMAAGVYKTAWDDDADLPLPDRGASCPLDGAAREG